jgi:hypothetical protein
MSNIHQNCVSIRSLPMLQKTGTSGVYGNSPSNRKLLTIQKPNRKIAVEFYGVSSSSYPKLAYTLEPGPTLPMNTTRTAAYLKFHERNIQYKDRD